MTQCNNRRIVVRANPAFSTLDGGALCDSCSMLRLEDKVRESR
jgi:hypothetical protein